MTRRTVIARYYNILSAIEHRVLTSAACPANSGERSPLGATETAGRIIVIIYTCIVLHHRERRHYIFDVCTIVCDFQRTNAIFPEEKKIIIIYVQGVRKTRVFFVKSLADDYRLRGKALDDSIEFPITTIITFIVYFARGSV